MQHELVLKTITHAWLGVTLITLLLLLLIGLHRETRGGEPIRGMVHLGILVMGLCTFLALMAAMYSGKKIVVPEKISSRLDTVEFHVPTENFGEEPG
jgi:hypothetical protein